MTKRTITALGIVLILLIAIGITIVLGGSSGASGAVGSLHQRTSTLAALDVDQSETLEVEQLAALEPAQVEMPELQQASLVSRFGESLGGSKRGLESVLSVEMELLTASVGELTPRLDLNNHLLNLTPLAGPGDSLGELLLEA